MVWKKMMCNTGWSLLPIDSGAWWVKWIPNHITTLLNCGSIDAWEEPDIAAEKIRIFWAKDVPSACRTEAPHESLLRTQNVDLRQLHLQGKLPASETKDSRLVPVRADHVEFYFLSYALMVLMQSKMLQSLPGRTHSKCTCIWEASEWEDLIFNVQTRWCRIQGTNSALQIEIAGDWRNSRGLEK